MAYAKDSPWPALRVAADDKLFLLFTPVPAEKRYLTNVRIVNVRKTTGEEPRPFLTARGGDKIYAMPLPSAWKETEGQALTAKEMLELEFLPQDVPDEQPSQSQVNLSGTSFDMTKITASLLDHATGFPIDSIYGYYDTQKRYKTDVDAYAKFLNFWAALLSDVVFGPACAAVVNLKATNIWTISKAMLKARLFRANEGVTAADVTEVVGKAIARTPLAREAETVRALFTCVKDVYDSPEASKGARVIRTPATGERTDEPPPVTPPRSAKDVFPFISIKYTEAAKEVADRDPSGPYAALYTALRQVYDRNVVHPEAIQGAARGKHREILAEYRDYYQRDFGNMLSTYFSQGDYYPAVLFYHLLNEIEFDTGPACGVVYNAILKENKGPNTGYDKHDFVVTRLERLRNWRGGPVGSAAAEALDAYRLGLIADVASYAFNKINEDRLPPAERMRLKTRLGVAMGKHVMLDVEEEAAMEAALEKAGQPSGQELSERAGQLPQKLVEMPSGAKADYSVAVLLRSSVYRGEELREMLYGATDGGPSDAHFNKIWKRELDAVTRMTDRPGPPIAGWFIKYVTESEPTSGDAIGTACRNLRAYAGMDFYRLGQYAESLLKNDYGNCESVVPGCQMMLFVFLETFNQWNQTPLRTLAMQCLTTFAEGYPFPEIFLRNRVEASAEVLRSWVLLISGYRRQIVRMRGFDEWEHIVRKMYQQFTEDETKQWRDDEAYVADIATHRKIEEEGALLANMSTVTRRGRWDEAFDVVLRERLELLQKDGAKATVSLIELPALVLRAVYYATVSPTKPDEYITEEVLTRLVNPSRVSSVPPLSLQKAASPEQPRGFVSPPLEPKPQGPLSSIVAKRKPLSSASAPPEEYASQLEAAPQLPGLLRITRKPLSMASKPPPSSAPPLEREALFSEKLPEYVTAPPPRKPLAVEMGILSGGESAPPKEPPSAPPAVTMPPQSVVSKPMPPLAPMFATRPPEVSVKQVRSVTLLRGEKKEAMKKFRESYNTAYRLLEKLANAGLPEKTEAEYCGEFAALVAQEEIITGLLQAADRIEISTERLGDLKRKSDAQKTVAFSGALKKLQDAVAAARRPVRLSAAVSTPPSVAASASAPPVPRPSTKPVSIDIALHTGAAEPKRKRELELMYDDPHGVSTNADFKDAMAAILDHVIKAGGNFIPKHRYDVEAKGYDTLNDLYEIAREMSIRAAERTEKTSEDLTGIGALAVMIAMIQAVVRNGLPANTEMPQEVTETVEKSTRESQHEEEAETEGEGEEEEEEEEEEGGESRERSLLSEAVSSAGGEGK